MKYPAGSKGKRRGKYVRTPKLPAYPKSAGLGDRGTNPRQPVVSVPSTPAAPAAPTPPPTTSASTDAKTAAGQSLMSGDPWEVAKKIVDEDIANQTKVIQGQKDAAAARNQAILNTFLGFQAALSKLSGTLGPQYDAAMKDLSNSQAAFSQGFKDAQGHIQGQQGGGLADVARANNPFWTLPGNLASQGQLLGQVQAKQLNDQLAQYDLQIQGLSGNRMKDIFSLYSDLQNSQAAQMKDLADRADKMTNMTGFLYDVGDDGTIAPVLDKKGRRIPMPGTAAYRNLTARDKADADHARSLAADASNRYFKWWGVAGKMTDDTGVLWLVKPNGSGIYQAKDKQGNPISAPGSTAAGNAAVAGRYDTSQVNAAGVRQAAAMTKADPNNVYTYDPQTGTITSIPRTYRPSQKSPKDNQAALGKVKGAIRTEVRSSTLWKTVTVTDKYLNKTTKRVPRMTYKDAFNYLYQSFRNQWVGNDASFRTYVKSVLIANGIKPAPPPAYGPPSPYG